MKSKTDAVLYTVARKIQNKQLYLPVKSIDIINDILDIICEVRSIIKPSFKDSKYEINYRKDVITNCACFYTSFYNVKVSNHGGVIYKHEHDLRNYVGGADMLEFVKFIMTDIDSVCDDNNSNRKITKGTSISRGINLSKKYQLNKLKEQVIRQVHKSIRNSTTIEEIIEVVEQIQIHTNVVANFFESIKPIEVNKNRFKIDNGEWNSNQYRVIDRDVVIVAEGGDIIHNNVVANFSEDNIVDFPLKRYNKIYTEVVNKYGIGNDICYQDYSTSVQMSYDIDYEKIIYSIEGLTNSEKIDAIKDYENLIINRLHDTTQYKKAVTDDRHYNPYQNIKSELRKAINALNGFTEADYSSFHINIILAIICGDLDMHLVYDGLQNETKASIKKALESLNITEDDKIELRSYMGDFYTKVINKFNLSCTRDVMKAETVSYLNIESNRMFTFKCFESALNSSDALRKVKKFLVELKQYDHKNTYKMLFKIESIIISEIVKYCIKNNIGSICIHDAISIPVEHANAIKTKMIEIALKYNIQSDVKIDIKNDDEEFDEFDEEECTVPEHDDFDDYEYVEKIEKTKFPIHVKRGDVVITVNLTEDQWIEYTHSDRIKQKILKNHYIGY